MKKRISEAAAYRKWHAAEKARADWRRTLGKIQLDIEYLEHQLADALARQRQDETERRVSDLTERMLRDKAFARVLRAYTGHTPHGWRMACGCDGRMKALANDWPVLEETIRRVRIAKGMIRMPCRCAAKVLPDATLALKIQLGYRGV